MKVRSWTQQSSLFIIIHLGNGTNGEVRSVTALVSLRDVIFVDPGEDEQYGTIKYSNEVLRRNGIVEGLEIGFTPESEYEFELDGQVLYKMRVSDICLTK
jgi:hypothetical protein